MDDGPQLATVLRERSSEILAGWIARFERSPLRFRRAAKASTYTAQVASLVEALTEAVAHDGGAAESLRPGSDATRELERSAAFLGAQFASEGATGYDIAALLLELRDVIAGSCEPAESAALTRLFEWLTVIALDGFAASGLQSLREQTSEQLEMGTPVVEILPKVPAVMLVGAPSANVLDGLLSRAWMMAVSTGAPCLIIDCGGLAEAGERMFERGYTSFLKQAEGSALQVLVSTARRPLRELAEKLTSAHGLSFQHFDRFDSAVSHALERAGHLLMRRG
ncbi:MAG TPA: hypothetical protein VMJ10_09095 [Kofleriaceae bacterium]|nr:hypothetical protein [Kofleriaceae bacterium]